MKVLIAAGIFPPDIGGPAIYAKEIAEEFNKQGIKTDVVCYAKENRKDIYNLPHGSQNFKVFKILRKHPLFLRYFLYFWRVLTIGRNYDIIFAQGPVSSGYPAKLANKFLRRKFIVKVTGDYTWEQARNLGVYTGGIEDFQKIKVQGKIRRLQKIERKVCESADLIIAPSEYLKKIVIGWGIKPEKIKVIYNAIRNDIISQSNNKDNNLIVSIGRLVSWKGFDTLIELMPELLKINPDFKLMIFGSGPEEDNLKNLALNLNLKEKVFIEYKPHGQVLELLGQVGIFVLNSDYEGLSHTVLEAMASRVPVITTNIGGNPEVIKDNYNGFLVEYNNKEQLKKAVLGLYHSQELQKKFIENSKEVLKKFNFDKMVKDTLTTLKSL